MMTTAPPSERLARGEPASVGAAVDYDAWFDKPWGRYALAVESAAIIRAAGALDGTRVLDAGCGPGRFGAALADHHALVAGIDPNRDMLALARAGLAGGCAQGVVERLPFADETFDLTLAVTVLEFVADPAGALVELARVTRGGGRIVIGALNPHSPWGLANRRRLRAGLWWQARFLSPTVLRTLGAPHGASTLHGVLYAPGAFPSLATFGPVAEAVGRAFPSWGAFQVLAIHKDRDR
jgi:SAM-dependent methyltransferase